MGIVSFGFFSSYQSPPLFWLLVFGNRNLATGSEDQLVGGPDSRFGLGFGPTIPGRVVKREWDESKSPNGAGQSRLDRRFWAQPVGRCFSYILIIATW